MIAPPPDRASLDASALDPQGRQRYLKLLESKLDKLEGRNTKLSSKDVLAAISEAREDHLRSHMTSSNDPKNDPWSRREERGESGVTSYVNEFVEGFEDEAGGSHDRDGYCLCCCAVSTRDYQRLSVDKSKEESRYLIDNDELTLSQQRSESEPSNGTIDKTFADNFV